VEWGGGRRLVGFRPSRLTGETRRGPFLLFWPLALFHQQFCCIFVDATRIILDSRGSKTKWIVWFMVFTPFLLESICTSFFYRKRRTRTISRSRVPKGPTNSRFTASDGPTTAALRRVHVAAGLASRFFSWPLNFPTLLFTFPPLFSFNH
jgi:hypothetical protein